MTDYTKLIDAETWAFIEKSNSFYPPETATYAIDRQREVYNRMCAAFRVAYPQGVTAHDGTIEGPGGLIPVRYYDTKGTEKAPALVLYFHGGGFVVGGLESHDDICAEICARTGFRVVSVDYRLCPEHVHPAAFEDALAAWRWAVTRFYGPVLLVGDSAGGNLAAAVAHATRGETRRPAGQVLIYPGLGGDISRGSYVTHAEAPMLTLSDLHFYRDIRSGGADTSADPTFGPLAATDYTGLPPTVVVSAECDPLCDDGGVYCERIRQAGGRAEFFAEEGLVHAYLRARHSVRRARRSFDRIVAAIGALGRAHWPY